MPHRQSKSPAANKVSSDIPKAGPGQGGGRVNNEAGPSRGQKKHVPHLRDRPSGRGGMANNSGRGETKAANTTRIRKRKKERPLKGWRETRKNQEKRARVMVSKSANKIAKRPRNNLHPGRKKERDNKVDSKKKNGGKLRTGNRGKDRLRLAAR